MQKLFSIKVFIPKKIILYSILRIFFGFGWRIKRAFGIPNPNHLKSILRNSPQWRVYLRRLNLTLNLINETDEQEQDARLKQN